MKGNNSAGLLSFQIQGVAKMLMELITIVNPPATFVHVFEYKVVNIENKFNKIQRFSVKTFRA